MASTYLMNSPVIGLIGDIGGPELMLIFALVLLLFGGKRLPEFARGLGKSIRELKKATSGVEEEIKRAMEEPPPPRKRPAALLAPVPAALPSHAPTGVIAPDYHDEHAYDAHAEHGHAPISDPPVTPEPTSSPDSTASPEKKSTPISEKDDHLHH